MCNGLRTLIIGYLIYRRKNGTVKIVSPILKFATFSAAILSIACNQQDAPQAEVAESETEAATPEITRSEEATSPEPNTGDTAVSETITTPETTTTSEATVPETTSADSGTSPTPRIQDVESEADDDEYVDVDSSEEEDSSSGRVGRRARRRRGY